MVSYLLDIHRCLHYNVHRNAKGGCDVERSEIRLWRKNY